MNNIKWIKNTLTSPLEGELDVIAVKRKCDYPKEGTIVKLVGIKNDFPSAEIRFHTQTSLQNPINTTKKCAEGLCYLHFTERGEWKTDANGNWSFVKEPIQDSPQDGYIHAITNTYGMTNNALTTLTEQMLEIKNILIYKILENKKER